MFILDTNVVSELRKARSGKADPNVAHWAESVNAADLYISAVTVQELDIGVLLVERRDPRQGALLRAWLSGHVLPTFAQRILPVDTAVAQRSAKLHVPNPQPLRDGLIAATALVHGMTVVTRNVADFVASGVGILDPWEG
ncbi:twitching motility protein PilT [Leminorella grimontii]|uniref:Ribonuclease VapC n=1 Tax=Leminorella grimontii TaxID=82981 RepID=A0AAV5N823_9GAMM|nr:type II toxin-antitoxin system VapC family toxin [Leminorella grimontii]KFC94945.1 PIN domain-containing protein [Leminorella grimontii ATCC 33999 = DSM 5078]GKX56911.1 twitching motility protein PilT [Leminorella grimontii]VFS61141.1 Probable ribonuclease FitB [Leminorella grimontii]